MAYSYIRCDREQAFLLPPSMLDWIPENHLAFFVIEAVDLIDTSAFHEVHPNDGPGRKAYDPDMMLTLLLYAYCIGMRSSRVIRRSCQTDLAFRIICANNCPDHTTIAAFRADNEAAIKGVFVEVVRLCRIAGLASLGQIAIDGTKIGSDAALDANRHGEWITNEIAKILDEAAATDHAEEADAEPQLFEPTILPEPLRHASSRIARLQAALKEAQAQDEAARGQAAERQEKAEAEAAAGRKAKGRKPKDPHAAAARAETDLTAAKVKADRQPGRADLAGDVTTCKERLAEARRVAEAAPARQAVANITDPDSRIMKTKDGWVQGFNVQAGVNENQVVIAYAVTQDHNDVNQLDPMVQATEDVAKLAGINDEIGLILADAGYWSEDNATVDGPDRLIATTKDWKQRKAAREMGTTVGPPPDGSTPLDAMEHRLRTEEGSAAYAARSYTVEPVFGDVKENHGFRRFIRRGLSASDSEAGLILATHNLWKIFHHNPSAIFGTT